MRVLHISSSPRADESVSRRLGAAFLDGLRDHDPDLEVDALDVWRTDLPDFDPDGVGVKYKRISGESLTAGEATVAATVDDLVARFVAADRIVVEVPMWNWSLPYRLKQLVDLVCQRGALFDYVDGVYVPLLSVPRGLVIGVRGQDRDAGFGAGLVADADHHVGYLRFWLAAIGVARIDTVLVDHAWDDGLDDLVTAGLDALRTIAQTF